MDKITKLLKKLTEKERRQVAKVLSALLGGRADTLNIKKLVGRDDIYRVRAGNLRVIFVRERGSADIRILEISRRSEDTYKGI